MFIEYLEMLFVILIFLESGLIKLIYFCILFSLISNGFKLIKWINFK